MSSDHRFGPFLIRGLGRNIPTTESEQSLNPIPEFKETPFYTICQQLTRYMTDKCPGISVCLEYQDEKATITWRCLSVGKAGSLEIPKGVSPDDTQLIDNYIDSNALSKMGVPDKYWRKIGVYRASSGQVINL